MIGKGKIIEKCLDLIKGKKTFEKEAEKFKKKYPQSYIHGNFTERIKGKMFCYGKEFYRPESLVIERDKPIIECQKWGVFSWSVGSLNKIPLERFENFKEVNKEDVKNICNKQLRKYIEGIISLERNVLDKFANPDLNEGGKKNG